MDTEKKNRNYATASSIREKYLNKLGVERKSEERPNWSISGNGSIKKDHPQSTPQRK